MTVPFSLAVSGPYTCDGTTTDFAFNFKIILATHLQIVVFNATTGAVVSTLVNGAGYSVLTGGLKNDLGGTVRISAAPLAGNKLSIARVVPYTQPNRIGNQGAFLPETHESTFDLLEMQIQQVSRKAGTGMALPIDDDQTLNMTLPNAVARANRVLAFNADGKPIAGADSAAIAGAGDAAAIALLSAASSNGYAANSQASALSAAASAAAAATFDPSAFLSKADNLNSVVSKPNARANLGLATTSDGAGLSSKVVMTDASGKLPAADGSLLTGVNAGGFPKGYLFPRSILTYVSGTSYTIAAGAARSDDDTTDLKWSSVLTLNTATTGANGMDVAITNGQTVHHFVIYNPTTTTYAAFGSSSLNPTLPAGFTKKRRVGSLRCSPGTTTLPLVYNVGDKFYYIAYATEMSSAVFAANTAQTVALAYVPQGLKLKIQGKVAGSGTGSMWIDNPTMTQSFPNSGLNTMSAYFGVEHVYCDTSAQIRIILQAGGTIGLSTEAWDDTREA